MLARENDKAGLRYITRVERGYTLNVEEARLKQDSCGEALPSKLVLSQ